MTESLFRMEHISVAFPLKRNQKVQALCDVELEIFKGETLGIVGESGCGKSTLARTIMGLFKRVEGKCYFHNQYLDLSSRKNRLAYARKVQMIFQDPYSSLNPRMAVGDIVAENMAIQGGYTREDRQNRTAELLEMVGLKASDAGRFPNEFSGGQRQRIGIARALALTPELLICDEPTSALDVSIQGQIMNLLKHLGKKMELTYVFIAHDLNMVHYISDRVAVMYMGNVVELAKTSDLYESPCHPYTKLLLEAVLPNEPGVDSWDGQQGEAENMQNLADSPAGCPFAGRCKAAKERCRSEKPNLLEIVPGHFAACHYLPKISA